ncbi:terminase large subunit domain-containing protein [Rhodococcus opacus]|uniref:terminase large subunit domain-containing protein n=1 Tax=Rhodococcus opacus TaxID=37919 RepID=UPI000FFB65F8|nr:terminase large subunit [Rhodococcus opacus]
MRQQDGSPLVADPYQTKVIDSVLEIFPEGHEKAGEYRFKQAIVSIPRRNGKSTLTSILALFAMCASSNAPDIGVFASTRDQAKEVFNNVKYNFLNNEALKARFKCTQHKGIESRRADKPAEFKIHAADGDTLQGKTFRGIVPVINDELHITKPQAYDAAVKGASTDKRNGPVIGITTAGDDNSELLKRLYERGRRAIKAAEEDERFGFWHWYVPEETDLWDKEALLRANPAALFGRIDIDQEILDGKSNAAGDYFEFRRYRRNQFVSSNNIWLGLDQWKSGNAEGIPDDYTGPRVFAIDRTEQYGWVTITAAAKIDELVYTERVMRQKHPTIEWITQACIDLFSRWGAEVFVANVDTLKEVIVNLRDVHGIPAEYLTNQQMISATAIVGQMIGRKRLMHDARDPIYKKQLPNTVAVASGEGIKVSTKESTGDIDAVRSMIMSCYKAESMEPQFFTPVVF